MEKKEKGKKEGNEKRIGMCCVDIPASHHNYNHYAPETGSDKNYTRKEKFCEIFFYLENH